MGGEAQSCFHVNLAEGSAHAAVEGVQLAPCPSCYTRPGISAKVYQERQLLVSLAALVSFVAVLLGEENKGKRSALVLCRSASPEGDSLASAGTQKTDRHQQREGSTRPAGSRGSGSVASVFHQHWSNRGHGWASVTVATALALQTRM